LNFAVKVTSRRRRMRWWRTFSGVANALSNDPASPLGRTPKLVHAYE
jgi:hypothetical protein